VAVDKAGEHELVFKVDQRRVGWPRLIAGKNFSHLAIANDYGRCTTRSRARLVEQLARMNNGHLFAILSSQGRGHQHESRERCKTRILHILILPCEFSSPPLVDLAAGRQSIGRQPSIDARHRR
jgi:hypothetical protein